MKNFGKNKKMVKKILSAVSTSVFVLGIIFPGTLSYAADETQTDYSKYSSYYNTQPSAPALTTTTYQAPAPMYNTMPVPVGALSTSTTQQKVTTSTSGPTPVLAASTPPAAPSPDEDASPTPDATASTPPPSPGPAESPSEPTTPVTITAPTEEGFSATSADGTVTISSIDSITIDEANGTVTFAGDPILEERIYQGEITYYRPNNFIGAIVDKVIYRLFSEGRDDGLHIIYRVTVRVNCLITRILKPS